MNDLLFGVDDEWKAWYENGMLLDAHWLAQSDHLREWSVFHEHERWPNCNSDDLYEKRLGQWMMKQRTQAFRRKLSLARIAVLDRIHPGILSPKATTNRCDVIPPEWLAVFDAWAAETTEKKVRWYKFPSIGMPYVAEARSFKEHIVRTAKWYEDFQPEDCHPSRTTPGTMPDVLSYLLFPDERTREHEHLPPRPFTENRVERTPPLYHSNCGKLFRMPDELLGKIDQVMDLLLPNNLYEKLKNCTPDGFVTLMLDGEHAFDHFHVGKTGYYYTEICNIMETKQPQPRRAHFGCSYGPPRRFPRLGVHCQRFALYGAAHRAYADVRCRPMPEVLYDISVAVWKHIWHELSPLSKCCPPFWVSAQLYPFIAGPSKHLSIKGEMRIHKDGGVQKLDPNGQPEMDTTSTSADRYFSSTILGSDVVMLTIGDTMDYHLIRPDPAKGQDHTMSAGEARENWEEDRKEQKQGNKRLKLVKTIPLDEGSIYIHTANDDEMYHHTLSYPQEILDSHDENHIRVALVFRWLSKSAYFRHDESEDRSRRYSMVNRYAFQKLNNWKKGPLWYKALGYADGKGNNPIKKLME
ncbi:hypothetical protein ACHAXT_001643 [Thalassiosira profunda]